MSKKKAAPKKKSERPDEEVLPFEDGLGQLEEIVSRLESGGGPLEEALEDYAKAIQLMKGCHQQLAVAERRIEVLSGFDAQGNPVTRELGDDDRSLEEKQAARSERRSAGQAGKSSRAPKRSQARRTDIDNELF